ncbi:tetratricopeptide repeat protein [Desertifilum sp. FACHB-1129]|uniref:Glycosyltransferase n=1 Tax=Desertifilum tharense IPPAS B-1220 TaxID=1781255 RepID=A0A1E5QK21_9CYAN|nr:MULTISPECIES: tetratricopeptide repeat protein [Desertifilum]MDA0210451.1 tetratricopeptide repeat protein [Cyanobacteria bacterium FC1]MBD2313912.1 tetratricopeptide repeat protein [Desertifilum sp. FACHB-1129]MBD2324744.1 tetratricopeptide repeat protein [Desertifilum sp. FACHB-866]MBD2334862.1 tetratricopeptide repeat protein [Desertifilum sp. FACHB-868]OEJ75010.1 glycosyltransferase [Desertifilum tharense IPPAS B-1220]
MRLSLCAIVKNEEASLMNCLMSVKDVVDEMVVLDTGSTDRTVAIAKAFGATVGFYPWQDDFAAARNESLKFATGDWILVLDADEVLKPEIVPQIRQAMQNEHHLLVNLVRQEVGATQSPYSLVSRLFRCHPEIQFTHPYHAMVDDSVASLRDRENHWQVVSLSAVAIEHYGYQPGAIAGKNKLARAKTAMEAYLSEFPEDTYTASKLGAIYVQLGEITQGIALLEQAIPKEGDPLVLFELHYHLGIAQTRLENFNAAKMHYQAACELPILRSLKLGAYLNWGNLLKAEGNLGGAILAYQQALAIDPQFAAAYYNLGMVCKQLGKIPEAIAAYQSAIQLNPHYAEAYQNLGVAFLKGGNVPASLKAFSQAIALYQKSNPQEAQRIRQELQTMGFKV